MKLKTSLILILLFTAQTAFAFEPLNVEDWQEEIASFRAPEPSTLTRIRTCLLNFPCYQKKLGAFTTISTATGISGFPTIYNLNLTQTVEVGTSSVASITTLQNLVSIGTLTTGTWNAGIIQGNYGGTGTSSPAKYKVIIGYGSSGFATASGTGSSGQLFTSNGEGSFPTWQDSSLNLALGYQWTGVHSFQGGFTASSSNYLSASTTITGTSTLGVLRATSSVFQIGGSKLYSWPENDGYQDEVLTTNGAGTLTFEPKATTTVTIIPTPAYGVASSTNGFAVTGYTTLHCGLYNFFFDVKFSKFSVYHKIDITSNGAANFGIYTKEGNLFFASTTPVFTSITDGTVLTTDMGSSRVATSSQYYLCLQAREAAAGTTNNSGLLGFFTGRDEANIENVTGEPMLFFTYTSGVVKNIMPTTINPVGATVATVGPLIRFDD